MAKDSKGFSQLAVQYNLHLQHLEYARDRFEEEARGFAALLRLDIVRVFAEVSVGHPKWKIDKPQGQSKDRSIVAKNFYLETFIPIMLKRDTKNMCVGRFYTGIMYDEDLASYFWFGSFTKDDRQSQDISELCLEKIRLEQRPVFKNSKHGPEGEAYLFRYEINEAFPQEEMHAILKEAVGLLMEVLDTVKLVLPATPSVDAPATRTIAPPVPTTAQVVEAAKAEQALTAAEAPLVVEIKVSGSS